MGHFYHGYVSLPEGISIPGGFMVDFSRGIHGFIASNIPVDSGWNSVRILVDKTDGFHHVGVGSGAGGWFEEDFWFRILVTGKRFHNYGKIHHSTIF